MPDWYPVITAARYLGVAPWELVEQPAEWMDWALAAQEAEAQSRPRQKPAAVGPQRPGFRGLA